MQSFHDTCRIISVILLFLALPMLAHAQTTLTADDFLGLIGKSDIVESDTVGMVAVNPGSPGSSQTWDFRNVSLQAMRESFTYLDPAGTPFASDFPDANFAIRFEIVGQSMENYQAFAYFDVRQDGWYSLGSAATFNDTTFFEKTNPALASPLPLSFGKTWPSVEVFSFEFSFGNQTFISIDSTVSSSIVDAWGTVRLPIGDFQVLRVCSRDTNYSMTVFGGAVISSDTTVSIEYNYVGKNHFIIATIGSEDGETNPNFTTANTFDRLSESGPTAVSEGAPGAEPPTTFDLAQNFPNPFNPETRIAFTVARAGQVELAIFDLTGKRVRTLVSGPMQAGAHSLVWDGTNDAGARIASGQYVYQLKFDNNIKSKMMVMIK